MANRKQRVNKYHCTGGFFVEVKGTIRATTEGKALRVLRDRYIKKGLKAMKKHWDDQFGEAIEIN